MAQRRGGVLRTAAAVAVLSTACGVAGCAPVSNAPDGQRTVLLQRPAGSTNDTEIYDSVFSACEKTTGITIKTQGIPSSGYLAKVLQQASSKTLPDVLMLDNGELPQIAESGALAPLKPLGVTTNGFADGVVQASTYRGELYGVQPVANTIALFVNTELLAAAGVKAPATWDELKRTASILTKGDTYGVAFSAAATEEGTFQFLPFFWSNGGDETNIPTSEGAAALQLWKDLVSTRAASESVLTWTQADVNDQFIAGKAAMMVNGPWQFPALDKAGVKYEAVALPAPKPGTEIVSPLGGETWTVPVTGNKEKMASAAKVVQCLGSDESQLKLGSGRNLIPTNENLAEQYAQENPKMKGFVEQIPGLRARTAQLGPDYAKASQTIYTAIQDVLTGGAEPLEALRRAEAK